MAYTDITSLAFTAIRWSDRQDMEQDLLVDFISNVTGRLNRLLRMPDQEGLSTILAFGGGIEIPQDFIALRSITGALAEAGTNTLQYIPQDVYQYYINTNKEVSNGTTYYTRMGRFWRVYPLPPADGVPFLVNYYTQLPELSQAVPTSWLLQKYPQAYLFGLLEQIYMYTMDQDRAAYWKEKFENAAGELQAESDQAHYSGTRLAIKEITRG